jgi:ankyrin repeat protein
MEACRIDNHKGIELLIKNGANPIAQDFNGLDALYYCVRFSNLQSLKVLVSLAFDKIPIERTYEKKKRNILTIASLYSEDEQILKFLLKNDFLRFNTN